ncbi:MAG: nucleoside monophosphate kinase [Euryarchaeota archaeon]|nr:nucleoside monophosphate kinase [Euryarchaeota archaeon]
MARGIVLFGAPGAGKGTLADKIKKVFPVVHVSTGDLLRENVRRGTEVGKKAKGFMDQGKLVPDDIVIAMVRERIGKDDARKSGFMLDGFPRTVEQAQALDKVARIDAVLVIDIKKEDLRKRILGRRSCTKCGKIYNIYNERLRPKREGFCDNDGTKLMQRDDDNEDTFEKRWNTYLGQSEHVIDYYSKKAGLVRRLDGTRTMDLSEEELRKALS